MNEMISEKNMELEKLRKKANSLSALEEEIDSLKRKVANQQAQITDNEEQIDKRNKQILDLKNRLGQAEQELVELQSRAQRVAELSSENERLKSMLEEKNRYIDELKNQLEDYERDGYDRNSQVEQIRILRDEVERLISENAELKKDNDGLKNELNFLRNQMKTNDILINDMRSKIDDANLRIQTLQKQVRQQQNLLDQTETELRDARNKMLSLKDIEHQYDDLKKEHNYLREKYDDLERENNNLKVKSAVLADLEGKVNILSTEYERLVNTLTERNKELDNWRAKYTQIELNLQKLADLEKRFNNLKQENANLKKLLDEKSAEIDEWVLKYGDIMSPDSEIQDLKKKLDARNKEVKALELKMLDIKEEYSKEMAKMLHKFNELDARNKKLSQIADDKDEEAMYLRQKCDQAENQLETIKIQLETKFRGRLEDVLQEITSKADAERNALENHLQQASQYISDLETRVTTLGADNERLQRYADDKAREVESLRIKLAGAEGNLNMLHTIQSTLNQMGHNPSINNSGDKSGYYPMRSATKKY
jgi:chromosome segregation ATPase